MQVPRSPVVQRWHAPLLAPRGATDGPRLASASQTRSVSAQAGSCSTRVRAKRASWRLLAGVSGLTDPGLPAGPVPGARSWAAPPSGTRHRGHS